MDPLLIACTSCTLWQLLERPNTLTDGVISEVEVKVSCSKAVSIGSDFTSTCESVGSDLDGKR